MSNLLPSNWVTSTGLVFTNDRCLIWVQSRAFWEIFSNTTTIGWTPPDFGPFLYLLIRIKSDEINCYWEQIYNSIPTDRGKWSSKRNPPLLPQQFYNRVLQEISPHFLRVARPLHPVLLNSMKKDSWMDHSINWLYDYW